MQRKPWPEPTGVLVCWGSPGTTSVQQANYKPVYPGGGSSSSAWVPLCVPPVFRSYYPSGFAPRCSPPVVRRRRGGCTRYFTGCVRNQVCRRWRRFGLGFEVVEYPLHQSGREGVGGDAAGAGDVEADGLAVQIHQRAAAKPGLQHRVVLDGLLEPFGALADFAAQAAETLLRI